LAQAQQAPSSRIEPTLRRVPNAGPIQNPEVTRSVKRPKRMDRPSLPSTEEPNPEPHPGGFGPGVTNALDALTEVDRRSLMAGQVVTRPVEFEHAGSTYMGGVSYGLVHARPLDVLAALREPGALRDALPSTLEARVLSDKDNVTRVEFTQGKSPFVGRYVVSMRWEPGKGRARFWLDPSRPHDLKDIWGFVRVTELRAGQTLVTWAVAFDLGQGMFGSVFERPVQRVALRTPATIRRYVENSLDERLNASR
jgi:hypothetical protein